MVILKNTNNKEGEHYESNIVEEQNEGQHEMEVENLIPPEPDNNPYQQAYNQQAPQYPQPAEIPLNEEALLELIKKEEENLAKNENEKTKSLEEIKNNLNSLNTFFNTTSKNLYEDSFYADLKKQISK